MSERASPFLVVALGLVLCHIVALFSTPQAAISATVLDGGGTASPNIQSATTTSIAPGANRLILAWIVSTDGTNAGLPSLSGNGLNWVTVNTAPFNLNGLNVRNRVTLLRAMGP